MKLDRTLVKEIKALNGSGSRKDRFANFQIIEAAAAALSTSSVMETFSETLRTYGRAAVAACVASTLYERRHRLDHWGFAWATEVLALWTNRGESFIVRAAIKDYDLHPTKICEYASSFIHLTTVD